MMNKNKILIPLDGSESAETILPLVCTLASQAESEWVLLHVVESLAGMIHTKKRDSLCEWQAYLERVSVRLTGLGYIVHTEIREGPVVEAILQTANCWDVNFIVVSTHGSSGYRGATTGSTANRVLRESKVPVMIIVHPERERFQVDPVILQRTIPVDQNVFS